MTAEAVEVILFLEKMAALSQIILGLLQIALAVGRKSSHALKQHCKLIWIVDLAEDVDSLQVKVVSLFIMPVDPRDNRQFAKNGGAPPVIIQLGEQLQGSVDHYF